MIVKPSDIVIVENSPGFHGKMIHSDHMTLAFWEVDKGAIGAEHRHHNEQILHVLEGEFEFAMGGKTQVCKAGDSVMIPSNALHGGKAITKCRLMDVFSPAREDYKNPAKK